MTDVRNVNPVQGYRLPIDSLRYGGFKVLETISYLIYQKTWKYFGRSITSPPTWAARPSAPHASRLFRAPPDTLTSM